MSDPATANVLGTLARIKVLPAHVIQAAIDFSGTCKPPFPRDLVHQACLDWRGDLQAHVLTCLGADEVLLDVTTEEKRLIVPGAPRAAVKGQSLPFFFQSQIVLLPTEFERVAPDYALFIADMERVKGRQTARAHLEFAMAVTAWVLLRLALEADIQKSQELIAAVSEDGIDVKWGQKPTLLCQQDFKSHSLVVTASMNGELVPKRKITVPYSSAMH